MDPGEIVKVIKIVGLEFIVCYKFDKFSTDIKKAGSQYDCIFFGSSEFWTR